MKRLHPADVLTLFRLLAAPGLLLFQPFSAGFFLLYLALGASDALDGPLARRRGQAGRRGARLDSAADCVLFATLLWVLLPRIRLPLSMLLWIAAIALIRLASLCVGFLRFSAFAPLHTHGNKAAGVALYCTPLLMGALLQAAAVLPACILATASALEELCMLLCMRTLERDTAGLFAARRAGNLRTRAPGSGTQT